MNNLTLLWSGFALAGFVLGLFVRPLVLWRIAIGLFMLAGLGLVLSNTAGWETAAYGFGVAMAGVAIIFALAIVGALAGRLVRRLMGIEDHHHHASARQYNSVLPD